MKDFCVFILSHGRAKKVKTLDTIRRLGYTGDAYIVVDDEDDVLSYIAEFGTKSVLVFSKAAVAKTFDAMDNFDERRTVVYARNACFDLARRVGVRWFLELDDDYTNFQHRWREDGKLMGRNVKSLDALFEATVRFLDASGAHTVAWAQGGDFITGKSNTFIDEPLRRKAMNSFFCDARRPFQFIGRINEDANTYLSLGARGAKLFTITNLMLQQTATQQTDGGMSEVYIDSGTYLKSFYTVMCNPSCAIVRPMGDRHIRLHHMVRWNNAVPQILDEKWRKT